MKALRPVPASDGILEKLEEKHGLRFSEVEELFGRPHLILRGSIDQYGERRYSSFGCSRSGRYLLVIYTVPTPGLAKVITARDMTVRERTFFRRKFRNRSNR